MAEFPYMRLWTDAFIGDTGHLSAAETGAYIMLLMCAWRTPGCCLPDDDKRLARMARCTPHQWAKVKVEIMQLWDLKDGKWTQKRLTVEHKFSTSKRQLSISAGKASALKRNNTGGASVAIPLEQKSNHTISYKESKKEIPKGISKENEKKAPKKQGERLPEKWWPEDKELNFAIERIGEVKAYDEIEKFRDHWAAAPGAKGRKADWPATWRNWIRRQPEFNPNSSRGSKGPSDIVASVSATVPLQSDKSRLRSNKIHHDPSGPGKGLSESGGAVGGKLGAIATRFDQVGVGEDEGEDSSQEHDNGRNHAAIYNLHG